jgi:membrane protein implicated in regulation of membrane protease activity
MLTLYIFSAILGGGLLLLGMVAGDGDAGGEGLETDADFGGKDLGWKKALSFRTAAYALAAFGLTGTALSLIDAAPFLTVVLAGTMALFGGILATVLFGWLARSQGGFGEPSDSYIGGIANAEIRIPDGGRGRVHLVHRGRAFTLPAVTQAGEIDRGELVIILDVVDGVAVVERAPRELLDATST